MLEGVELGDYQRETIAWLVARETSSRSMEDLFSSSFSKDLAEPSGMKASSGSKSG